MTKHFFSLCLLTLLLFISKTGFAEVSISGKVIPGPAKKVLLEILENAQLKSATVTDTTRSANEQARVMYNYVLIHGLEAGKDLYGPSGDKILEVYVENIGKIRETILELMTKETKRQLLILDAQGSSRTELMHTSESHYVFDVAPSSIKDRGAFEKAVLSHPKVSRFLKPPLDKNAYHIEIPK